jgi:hypothetical protein
LVDVDYYVCIGGSAYGALSRQTEDTFSPVFAELAANFVGFIDVLSEVSERSSCGSTPIAEALRALVENGSRRSGQLLGQGVVSMPRFEAARFTKPHSPNCPLPNGHKSALSRHSSRPWTGHSTQEVGENHPPSTGV